MENELALVFSESNNNTDELFRYVYGYFRTFFDAYPDVNVCNINLHAFDWPEPLLRDRRLTGVAFAGTLIAMLGHQAKTDVKLADLFLASPLPPDLMDGLDR